MTVALYARLSPKPSGGYEGVDDQVAWGKAYAAQAWPGQPVEVFDADRGLSGGREDTVRPDFQRLREWINAGKVQQVWTVEQSRLTRSEVEWFELAAELDAAGITEVHTNRDGIVRVRDEVAGIKAVINAAERRKMLRRLSDTLAEKAAKGEPPGVRPFGYVHATAEDGTRTYAVVPEQAEVIQFAAEKVLAGWSLASIAADLTAKGVRGTHGGKVTSGSVRSWLTSPSITGLRVHSGEVVGDGNWPPILDRATFRKLGSQFGGTRKVQRADGGTYVVSQAHRGTPGRRYLLTGGLAVCGVCEAPMGGSMKQLRNSTKPYLLCHPKNGGKGCTGVMLTETEEHVVSQLFEKLATPGFLQSLAGDADHDAERTRLVTALDEVESQRRELAGMWARRELTTAEWQAAKEVLADQEAQMYGDLAAVPASPETVDIDLAREDWDDLTLEEQRAVIRKHVAKVTIKRATRRGRPGLDADRVVIDWVRR